MIFLSFFLWAGGLFRLASDSYLTMAISAFLNSPRAHFRGANLIAFVECIVWFWIFRLLFIVCTSTAAYNSLVISPRLSPSTLDVSIYTNRRVIQKVACI